MTEATTTLTRAVVFRSGRAVSAGASASQQWQSEGAHVHWASTNLCRTTDRASSTARFRAFALTTGRSQHSASVALKHLRLRACRLRVQPRARSGHRGLGDHLLEFWP